VPVPEPVPKPVSTPDRSPRIRVGGIGRYRESLVTGLIIAAILLVAGLVIASLSEARPGPSTSAPGPAASRVVPELRFPEVGVRSEVSRADGDVLSWRIVDVVAVRTGSVLPEAVLVPAPDQRLLLVGGAEGRPSAGHGA